MNAYEALQAIKARINGEWSNPHLQNIGPLGLEHEDILHIIELAERQEHIDSAEWSR